MSAKKHLNKVWIYTVVDAKRSVAGDFDMDGAPVLPPIGEMVASQEDWGTGIAIREEDHGPIHDVIHLHYVGWGQFDPLRADEGVIIAHETKRMLALIKIGAKNEEAVHELVDDLFMQLEEYMGTGHGVDELSTFRTRFP